jgi:hypothetical protein
MTRKQRGLLLVLGLLAVAAISAWHIQSLMQSGQPVFWLAELWAPVGVLSIGVVSCLEYLLPGPGGPAKPSQKSGAKRSRSRS